MASDGLYVAGAVRPQQHDCLTAMSMECHLHTSASRSYSPPPSGWPTGSLHPKHHSMRSKYITGKRCSIRPGRGAYRADLAPAGFNTAPP